MSNLPNLNNNVPNISVVSSTAINNSIQCVTLVTNYKGEKAICTNGMNCNGVCVKASTGNSYCLTNVKFSNVGPSDFIGYYNPCKGKLSPLY